MKLTSISTDRPGNAPGEGRTLCESLTLLGESGLDMAALTALRNLLHAGATVRGAVEQIVQKAGGQTGGCPPAQPLTE